VLSPERLSVLTSEPFRLLNRGGRF
jgi:hypothetical protein